MATEIAVADPELEELMAQLEAETGVTVPVSPPPAAKVVSAVATPTLSEEELLLLELAGEEEQAAPVTSTNAAGLSDDAAAELLAALEDDTVVSKAVESVPVTITETPLSAFTVSVTENSAGQLVATGVGVGLAETALSPEDELAALEAELNGTASPATVTAAITTETTARAVQPVEEERGLSFIPGEVLVDPEKEIEEPGIMAAGALADAGLIKDGQPVVDAKTMFALDPLAGGQYYTDPTKFRVETSISDVDLDRCMIEQNGLRSFYGANAARAEAQADRLKLKVDVLEAKLYEEERRLAAEDGEKVTERMLENRVKSNPIWMKAKLAVIDAQGVSGINKALVESLKDRKDMLVQLGADRRGEMQGAVRTMASKDAAQSERDRATEAAQRAFQK